MIPTLTTPDYYICEHNADFINHAFYKQGRLSCDTERSAQES